MFPDVEAEEGGAEVGIRDEAFHEGVVLIGGAGDFEFVALADEPGPAGAEAFGGGFAEGGFEGVHGAEGGGDGGGEVVGGFAGGVGWGEGVPEEVVVPVAAAVVAEGVAEGFVFDGGKAADQLGEGAFGECRRGGEGGVEVVDVGGVVFAVVDFHGFGIDVGLQGIERVGKRGEGVGGAGGGFGILCAGGGGEPGGGGGEGAEFDELAALGVLQGVHGLERFGMGWGENQIFDYGSMGCPADSRARAAAPMMPASLPNRAGMTMRWSLKGPESWAKRWLVRGWKRRSPARAMPPPMMMAWGLRSQQVFMMAVARMRAMWSQRWRATGSPAWAAVARAAGVQASGDFSMPASA